MRIGDRLLVGLNTGSLRIYRVNEIPHEQNGSAITKDELGAQTTSPAVPKPVDLLRELEKFSNKSIEQLAIIKEANILISLSNYYVSIHDLQSYELHEQLTKTKGAVCFAVTSNIVKDSATGIPEIISRLAVTVKRRLMLWSWHESELSSDTIEITLPTGIRTLTWASATKIICGMNSGYAIVDVVSQEIEDIVGPGAIGGASGTEGGRFGGVGSASMGYMGLGGYIPKPLATRLSDGQMLLAKDINTLFIDSDGKPAEKRQVPWQNAPDAIGYSYPYMLALQAPSRGALEVRNPETLSLLQSISLPNASHLHFPPPTVSLAHAGKGFHVASDRCVWRMGATDYDTQVDELVEKGKYDEAVSILNMLEDALLRNKEGRLREIKMQKAQVLFDKRKYRDALDLFTEVSAPPERVIRLYPKIIAGELTTHEEKSEDEESHEGTNGGSVNGDTAVESSEGADAPKSAALINVLRQHKAPASDASSIRSVDDASDKASIKVKPAEEGPLQGKDLVNAVLELNAFLVDTRTRLQRFLDPATGKLKPIAVNGQNGASQQAFESLLLAPASDAEADREQKLRDTARLVDTTLFRGYMLARPSLAGALFRINNFCDPEVVNEKLLENGRYNDLVDFFHGKKLHRPALELLKKFGDTDTEDEAAPNLHGPQRTIGYLQALPSEEIDLVLEFAEWPLKKNPELGMEIFLADTENAETLPRDQVLTFLEGIDVDLAVRYLEHIIDELNDLTPDYHNRLVSAYVQELKERDDRDTDDWKGLMQRLLSFLKTSKQYSLSRAFGEIPLNGKFSFMTRNVSITDPYPDDKFYEAQAVLLSNMGQHKEALEIYVFKLKDYGKAEE